MAGKVNHHIVPQFYLRSFANGAGRKARFHAWEKETGASFGAVVRDVAAARHFNRILTEKGELSNALEDALAAIETSWAPLFDEVVAAGAFPSHAHREAILTMAAMLSLRSGHFRGVIEGATRRIHHLILEAVLSSKERCEAAHPDAKGAYEEMRRLWDNKKIKLSYEQTYFIAHELKLIDTVLERMDRRNWCFVRPAGQNRFITSDDPAVLHWVEEPDRSLWISPGHGVAATALTFPLSPELLVFGTFEPQRPQQVASDFEVAQFNGLIAAHSRRHFFARDMQFSIGMQEYGVQPATEIARIVRHLKERKASAGPDIPRNSAGQPRLRRRAARMPPKSR
jgi:Protein of unknown function (DUF4238)